MKKGITKITKTKTLEVYIATCENCGRKIEGYSEGQVIFNMDLHKKGKGCKK